MKKNEYIELNEKNLASYATRSSDLLLFGNQSKFSEDPNKTPFEKDRDFILHSIGLKKLAGKSQNLIADCLHNTTSRLIHTFQVVSIASKIANGLGLNPDLTEAIAIGHDVGHLPFSHNAQIALNNFFTNYFFQVMNGASDTDRANWLSKLRENFYTYDASDAIFSHQKQSYHVYHKIEPYELSIFTRVGLLHDFEPKNFFIIPDLNNAISYEMQVVNIADRIAWINHDISKAIEFGLIRPDAMHSLLKPNAHHIMVLVEKKEEQRIGSFIMDAIDFNLNCQRLEKGGATKGQRITLSPFLSKALDIMRSIIYEHIIEHDAYQTRVREIQDTILQFVKNELAERNICSSPKQKPNVLSTLEHLRSICDRLWDLEDYQFLLEIKRITPMHSVLTLPWFEQITAKE